MRKLAIVVPFVLLLVGLPVGVTFALTEATSSAWALPSGATVTICGGYGLLIWLHDDPEDLAVPMLGVALAVLGVLWALVGFDVIAVSWGSGGALGAVIGLIMVVVGLVLAVFGVHRFL